MNWRQVTLAIFLGNAIVIVIHDLYRPAGAYRYVGGFSPVALAFVLYSVLGPLFPRG